MKRFACLVLAAGGLAASVAFAGEDAGDRFPSDEALRHYLVGRWLEETGDLAGAGAELSRAAALDPSATDILVHASEVASRAGDASRSLELATRVTDREPAHARALWLQGAALFNLSRAGEAIGPLRRAVIADGSDPDYLRTLAHVAESLDQVALVDSCYDRVVQLEPDDAESWFQLATTRARLGRFGAADSALTEALEENPARPGALFLRGWLAEQMGRPDSAIALYEHHLAVHSSDQTTRRRLVALLVQQGNVREALSQAVRVADAQPKDASAIQAVADLQFRAGHPDAGLRELARMRALQPGDMDLTARSAEVLVRNHRERDAIRLVDEWSASNPDEAHGVRMRGWVRATAGMPDSAAAIQRLEVAAYPDSQGPRRVLARYLREAHRWPEAAAELVRLREMAPGDPSLLLDLGFCREQMGDIPAAVQAGRDALALDPDAAPSLNFLGYLLADHDRDLSEAEDLVRRAVSQDPDNGAYLDSMGWVHFRRGRLAEARAELERATALVGNDPVVHEHLGDVYLQMRLFDLARQQYRISLAADDGNQRVRNKLEAAH